MKAATPTVVLVNVAVVGLLTAAAFMNTCCTGDQTLSPCTSSEQCNLSPGGQCLPSPLGEKLCAYPDMSCENTSLAWGQLSGELSGKCVVDTVAPMIVSRSPDDAATDVGTAINITVEFSEPIDPATLSTNSFKVTQGASVVEGTYAASGNTAVFQSSTRLAPNASYNVALSTDIADHAGNKLSAGSTWTFSTRSGGWQAPVVLKTDPNAETDDLITNFDDAGHGAAVWAMHPCSGSTCDTGSATIWASVYKAGAWSTPASLSTSPYVVLPNITVDALGNATAIWFEFSSTSDTSASLMASHYSNGSWSSPVAAGQDLGGNPIFRPSLDADAMGNVIAVWQQRLATPDLWWAKMSGNGTWAAAARLENAPEAAYSPVVGVAPDGTAVTAYEQPQGAVRTARYSAGSWGTSVPIKSGISGYGNVRVAADGSMHVIWASATDLWWTRYSNAWSNATAIDNSTDMMYFGTDLAFDASGQGIAVWSQGAAAQQDAYYAIYDPSTGWATAKTIETNIGTAGDIHVAYGASLAAMAMWIQPSGGGSNSVWSSVRNNSTNKWSVPELAETDDSGDASRASLFFDGTTNTFHAVWMQVTTGKHRSVYVGSFE